MKRIFSIFLFTSLLLIIQACSLKAPKSEWELSTFRPEFDEDIAYSFVEKQISFGYRNPGSPGHKKCRSFITETLQEQGYLVSEKEDLKQSAQGLIHIYNLKASFQPEKKKRIFLATSYDSRYKSQTDDQPILGANSAASGVAVMLEIAQLLNTDSLDYGIDFLFFDAQDQGHEIQAKTYNLGAQSWVKNNTTEYDYGLVLDMVGAPNATFVKEEFSGYFCKDIQDKIWEIAKQRNFEQYFPEHNITNLLINDHFQINNYSRGKTPTLLLTDFDSQKKSYFPEWHTHQDSMGSVDKKTLKAIGQTIIELLYLKTKS
jgi:hypothetical protein